MNKYEKELYLLALAEQEKAKVEEIFRSHHYLDSGYIGIANKLQGCCHEIRLKDDGQGRYKLMPNYTCGVRFCPVCRFFSIRKELGKFHQVFKKIQADEYLKRARYYYLTLTLKDVPVGQLKDSIAHLNDSFERLLEKKDIKKFVLGSSSYLHIGLNDYDRVQPHLHVVMMFKSSYVSKQLLNKSQWASLWQEAAHEEYLPFIECSRIGKGTIENPSDYQDLSKRLIYSMKTLEMSDIDKYPSTYLQVFSLMKDVRKVSHKGVIRTLRAEVKADYAAILKEKNRASNDYDNHDGEDNDDHGDDYFISVMKYDESLQGYYQDHCIKYSKR